MLYNVGMVIGAIMGFAAWAQAARGGVMILAVAFIAGTLGFAVMAYGLAEMDGLNPDSDTNPWALLGWAFGALSAMVFAGACLGALARAKATPRRIGLTVGVLAVVSIWAAIWLGVHA